MLERRIYTHDLNDLPKLERFQIDYALRLTQLQHLL